MYIKTLLHNQLLLRELMLLPSLDGPDIPLMGTWWDVLKTTINGVTGLAGTWSYPIQASRNKLGLPLAVEVKSLNFVHRRYIKLRLHIIIH